MKLVVWLNERPKKPCRLLSRTWRLTNKNTAVIDRPRLSLFWFVLGSWWPATPLNRTHPNWWPSVALTSSISNTLENRNGFVHLIALLSQLGQHFQDVH
jgi:hypothetical protein